MTNKITDRSGAPSIDANAREEDAVYLNNFKCDWNTKCLDESFIELLEKSLNLVSFNYNARKMRSHNQHIALKQRKRKLSSKNKSSQTLATRARWPRVISRSKKLHGKSNDTERSLPRFDGCSTIIDANDSNVISCDIVELFCKNSASNEERMACPRISSSTEFEENEVDVCATCKDCAECRLQQQDNAAVAAKMRKTKGSLMSGQDEELAEHPDYYEDIETTSTTSTVASIEYGETPILVDLTSEESKQAIWKQTILKRFGEVEENSEMSEPCIMIADSSSRLQRGSTGNSLATALRDRGPCVIPVQPNRSLPIRPAPPMPTRSAASIVTLRKTRSPILKLSKSASLDVVKSQLNVSPSSSLTNELNEYPFGQQDGNANGMMLTSEFIDRSDYILPDMTNVVQIAKEINSKRKNGEDKEYEKEITKDVKKRRKFHEVDAGHIRDERVKNILKEYSRTCSGNLTDKGERKLQQHVVVRLWDDKRYSSPVVVSTTESETEKKEICNKVVPPLRLKKVVREANTTDEYRRNVEVNAEIGNESNYRIVTGATPRPESPSGYSATSFWSSMASEELESSMGNAQDKNLRSSPKSDGYKIKYRRNRLRQKLRELRGKALELSQEMAACNNATDTNPQRSTRLRQMMNCYEKQIENISKLLCKLSASIPPSTDDIVVDLDYENELNDERISVEKAVDSDAHVNGISRSSVSPSLSPEPPKLSPRSPIDYEKGKSPDAVRDSPPVLPRVYIAIQPTALECLKQNLTVTKSWHKDDGSSSLPIEKEVKVNDTDQTIIRDDMTMPAISPVSSSEFEDPRNTMANWNEEEPLPKLKNSEIEEKIPEDTKTFGGIEAHRQTIPTISSDSFLSSTMDIEIDGSDMRDTKERPVDQGHLDEVTQASGIVANKQVACEKQELEQKSNEALPSNASIVEEIRKTTEYETYNSEERINGKNRVVTSTVTTAQEASTMVERSQVPAANVTNILQLQSNYYGSSVARKNVVFTDVIQNSRDVQKVTSSINQPITLDPTMPLGFTQSKSTVSSSNQQCIVLPNSCNKATPENTNQRNDGNRIMTEQFPTLGNWVARMSKKQATKSKSKLQSGINLPTASTAEAARLPGLETQKIRSSAPSNTTRNNIVNVAPQWNTERWQRQQHQQRQQQLYASSAAPPVRPGICPPISVTQFYPSNYAIDPYGGTAFGYHSTICPYGDYSYHSRLHATAPPISGYQIGPLQDPHVSPLRQMQHLDKRYPAHLQDTASRHFTTDLLKYSSTLSAGGYQPAAAAAAAAAAAGLDYDRLRTATAATQNGTTSACLPPLLLPRPPSLAASAQQSLARTSLAGYPASNGQCGRNRMIPDVVAAAAAAAVVAAASFGRQRGTLPSYGRTDTEMVSGGIGSVMDSESSPLIAANRVASRERLPQEQVQPVSGVNVDSRLNNGGYRQLQNLILDRLPYIKADDAYSQSSTTIFDNDNAQESTIASSVPTSTSFKSPTILASSSALAAKEPVRKENRNCETPHLGKVNRTLETTSNLECSNCGLTGSMFKCLGCETAFYCDERCQTRHWSIHVEKCPKRMPKLKKLV